MNTRYWYKECPVCLQGRLFLAKDVTHDKIYLHCEECECGWDSAGISIEDSYLTIVMNYEMNPYPSINEIDNLGWGDIVAQCTKVVS